VTLAACFAIVGVFKKRWLEAIRPMFYKRKRELPLKCNMPIADAVFMRLQFV
jgi:hypothetical protein